VVARRTERASVCAAVVAMATLGACGSPSPEEQAAAAVREGVAFDHAGQPEPAAARFEHATQLDPSWREAWTRLARTRLDQERYAPARSAALRLVRLEPGSAYAHELLGRAELGAGDERAALAELDRVVALDPARAAVYLSIGVIHERAHRRPEALAAYGHAVEAMPATAAPRIARARVLLSVLAGADRGAGTTSSVGAPAMAAGAMSRPSVDERAEATRLLDDARAAKRVSDDERHEIVRLAALVTRLAADERRERASLYAILGPAESHAEALRHARAFGILGLLGSTHGSNGAVDVLGDGHMLGALMGDQIGDTFGSGGLGLRGTGLGGGGTGQGTLGLGGIGTIGHGAGPGGGSGYGRGSGSFGSASVGSAGSASVGAPTVTGSLDPATVQRVVARARGAIQACFARALASNPALTGGVTLALAIDASGTVTPTLASSTLGDATAEGCIVRQLAPLRFPAASAPTHVVVPFALSPGP